MNYVESLNLFGVEAKEIPCIKGNGAPTDATAGAVGCLYMDRATATGDLYKCTAILPDGGYKWDRVGGATSWADLGEGCVTTVLADNQVFSTAETGGEAAPLPFILKQGATYDVVCQGVPYTGLSVKSFELDGSTVLCVGNIAIFMPGEEDTGENFVFAGDSTTTMSQPKEPAENITLSVTEHAPGVLPLPQKYAPEIKRFYCGQMGEGELSPNIGYIYLDKEHTIRASKADLVECRTAFCLHREFETSPGEINYFTHYPLYVYSEDKYTAAMCVIRFGDEDLRFVTGEYVPE